MKKENSKKLGFLFNGREKVLNVFKGNIFPAKVIGTNGSGKTLSSPSTPSKKLAQGKGIKILTPKRVFKRLPIVIAQVKSGNTTENLLKKYITNPLNLIKVLYKTNTIFMNSKNSKTSDPYILILDLSYKTNLKRSNIYVTSHTSTSTRLRKI